MGERRVKTRFTTQEQGPNPLTQVRPLQMSRDITMVAGAV